MARSRSKSFEASITQLIALGVLGCAFSPFLRSALLWAVPVGLAALVIAVGYFRFRHPTRARITNKQIVETPINVSRPNARIPSPQVEDCGKIKSLDWFQFEKLIAALYEQQGYAVQRSGGANPDGGIDLVVNREGIASAVQCKHWKSWKVGVQQIREFLGVLKDRGFQNGIFVTLQEYTREAKYMAGRNRIRLVGEGELMQMLEAVNWKYNSSITSILHDTRKHCPKCESEMVLKIAKKGRNVGDQFWGCSSYPKCKCVIKLTPQNTAPFAALNPSH